MGEKRRYQPQNLAATQPQPSTPTPNTNHQSWTPTPPIWQDKGVEFYQKLSKGAASAGLAEQVLHITPTERLRMSPEIERHLETGGVSAQDKLGTHANQVVVADTIKALKNHPDFQAMLNWTLIAGETKEHVNTAIKLCIHSVHTARKKRIGREIKKEATRSISPSRGASATEIKPQPDAALAAEKVSTQKGALFVRLLPDAEVFEFVSLKDIQDDQGQLCFKKLQEKIEGILAAGGVVSKVEGFTWRHREKDIRIQTDSGLEYCVASSDHEPTLHANLKEIGKLPSRTATPNRPGQDKPIPLVENGSDPDESDELLNGRKRRKIRQPPCEHPNGSTPSRSPTKKSFRKHQREYEETNSDQSDSDSRETTNNIPQPEKQPVSAISCRKGITQATKPRLNKGTQPSVIGEQLAEPDSNDETDADGEDDEPSLTPQPETPAIDFTPNKLPPPNLPSWEDAEADCEIGEELPDQGHDDADPYRELQASKDPGVEDEEENEDDRLTREIVENEKKIRREKEHLDPELLKQMHALFKTDSDKLSGHDAMIPLQGLTRPLMIHQAYGAFWILHTETLGTETATGTHVPGIGYVYLADEPGYGKSATAASLIVLCRWLEIAWTAVDISRRRQDGHHLKRSEEGVYQQTPEDQCPSGEPFGICCPCVEANPASRLRPVKGVVIFMVPTELLINSVQEWYQQVDMDNQILGFRVYVQTTTPPKSKANIAKLVQNGEENNVDLATMLGDKNKATQLLSDSKRTLTGLLKYVFYCTPDSYNRFMMERGFHNLPCGRFLRDEFHQQPHMTNNLTTRAREIIRNRWEFKPAASPRITLMSGTPVRMGPQDLYGAMSLAALSLLRKTGIVDSNTKLHHPNHWKDISEAITDEFWKKSTPWGLSLVKQDWNSHDAAKSAAAKAHWSRFMMLSMIARGRGSQWLDGATLMPVPRMKYRLVQCTLTNHRQKQVRQILGRSTKEGSSRTSQLHKCGTFPGLAKLQRDTEYKFGKEWMDQSKVFTTCYKENILRQNIKMLVRSSPKMNHLQSILDEMLVRKDFVGRPAKGIIFTESNESALLIQLWIEEMYAPSRTLPVRSALIYGGMDKGTRQTLVSQFQNENKYNVIIGVANGLGTGVTLTRAMFTVIAEQIGDPGVWRQIIGRMLRKGNYNWNGVLVFELFASNWATEISIRQRRRGRHVWAAQSEKKIDVMVEQDAEADDVSDDEEESDDDDVVA